MLESGNKYDIGLYLFSLHPQFLEILKLLHAGHVIDSILPRLRLAAEKTLERKKYPVDLNELAGIDPCSMDIEAASAGAVLKYVELVKNDIKNNDPAQTMLDTMFLILSAIKANVFDYTSKGIGTSYGLIKSHTKEKLKGVLLAIEHLRKENPKLYAGRRTPIWDKLKELARKGTPLVRSENDIQYKLTFEGDTLVHQEITQKEGKQPKEVKTNLSRGSFINNYFKKHS